MNKDNFYLNMIENDLNPFILFDSNGKIKDFNKEAEFLFNFTKPKELYNLAVSHASVSFGFTNKFITLVYGKLKFYALLVGYINDNEIGLRLYKVVCTEDEINMKQDIELTNIFALIELSKNATLIQSDVTIEETYDVSMPEIKVNINAFILTLNDCFEKFKNNKTLKLKVSIKIGEYELIENNKYQVASIEFLSNNKIILDKQLKEKAYKANINIFVDENILILDFPMIMQD
jgi:hypothetical protein